MKIKKVIMQGYQLQLHCDCGLNLTKQTPRRESDKYIYVCPVCGREHETKECYGGIRYEEVSENEESNRVDR